MLIILRHLEARKAQEAGEYQWQKDNIKHITEQGQAEDAERAARQKNKQVKYRQDLFGQMDYDGRKKQQVTSSSLSDWLLTMGLCSGQIRRRARIRRRHAGRSGVSETSELRTSTNRCGPSTSDSPMVLSKDVCSSNKTWCPINAVVFF